MEAKSLTKPSKPLKEIYDDISRANERYEFKVFYPHWVYISDSIKLELISRGFKVYQGEWMRGDYGLIIEW